MRDLPRPERLSYEECARRRDEAVAAYWERERPRRANARQATRVAAQQSIGQLTDREIIIAGAIAYWCEGAKSKAYRRADRISFINSDPLLIRFFLRFLESAGVTRSQIVFRISIHESADVLGAQEFWPRVTQADPAQFRRPSLNRHNPKTVRLNTGSRYQGCLRVDVLRGGTLYKQIEGWCDAVMASAEIAADAESDGTARWAARCEQGISKAAFAPVAKPRRQRLF